MVRAKETVTDPDHVVAAVVLVIPHKDVQLGVERYVVDVSQAG